MNFVYLLNEGLNYVRWNCRKLKIDFLPDRKTYQNPPPFSSCLEDFFVLLKEILLRDAEPSLPEENAELNSLWVVDSMTLSEFSITMNDKPL